MDPRYMARVVFEALCEHGRVRTTDPREFFSIFGIELSSREDLITLEKAISMLIEKGALEGGASGFVIDLSLKRSVPMDDWGMGLPWEEKWNPKRPLSGRVVDAINSIPICDDGRPYALVVVPNKKNKKEN